MEEGAKREGDFAWAISIHVPSDMGKISLVGALCQVLCQQQPDQSRCKNFKAIEEDPLSSSMGVLIMGPTPMTILFLFKKNKIFDSK